MKKWRKNFNNWRDNHNFKQYSSKSQIDDAIVNKLESLLDDQPVLIKIVVKPKYRPCFSYKLDHESIGVLSEEDETHIKIKPIRNGYVGNLTRYPKNMVNIIREEIY